MSLSELIAAFENGAMEKAEFIAAAGDVHSTLYDYPDALRGSRVDQIRLDRDGVSFHVEADDLWLSCPPRESRVAPVEMINFRDYEPRETELMLTLLADASVVFDVGANIGWYSLLFARRCPNVVVHAFEPLGYFAEFLRRNVTANGFDERILTHEIGFSDENRRVEIFMQPGNATNASMRDVANADAASLPAAVRTMDDWCSEHELTPDFIKCDVEGAELLVMRGAEAVLSDSRPVLFLEILRKWAKPYGYHPNDLLRFLRGLGYVCLGIGTQGVRPVEHVDESTLETNYLFLHEDTHKARIQLIA